MSAQRGLDALPLGWLCASTTAEPRGGAARAPRPRAGRRSPGSACPGTCSSSAISRCCAVQEQHREHFVRARAPMLQLHVLPRGLGRSRSTGALLQLLGHARGARAPAPRPLPRAWRRPHAPCICLRDCSAPASSRPREAAKAARAAPAPAAARPCRPRRCAAAARAARCRLSAAGPRASSFSRGRDSRGQCLTPLIDRPFMGGPS
jgi:hypothetical protein